MNALLFTTDMYEDSKLEMQYLKKLTDEKFVTLLINLIKRKQSK